MTLQLRFADRLQLWAELIHTRADRVFVPTEEIYVIGQAISVEVALPELELPLNLAGSVVGQRPRSDRFAAGLFVSFHGRELEKCRAFLGLDRLPEVPVTGRKVSRVDCSLPLKFLAPVTQEAAVAKNLGETGLLAKTALKLLMGQRVQFQLGLDRGKPVELLAEVTWTREEIGLVGVQFIEPPLPVLEQLRACIGRLSSANGTLPSNRLILIADDDPIALDVVANALKQKGYSVEQVTRGDEAERLIRRLKPGLAILDVLMPGLDGKEVCRRMRADAEMARIPVILSSALDRACLHAVADEVGASDYLAKPLVLPSLFALVSRYL